MKESRKEETFQNDNRPNDKWYRLFLKRHPEMAPRNSQNVNINRENVTEHQNRRWFEEIKFHLTSKNLLDITANSTRVFNTAESVLYLCPECEKFLSKRGDENVYTSVGDEKVNLTVLVNTNATGNMSPPMIVFSYVPTPGHIAASVPTKWGIGTSENGWMCGETCFEYTCNLFTPWLEEQKIQKPIILFLDSFLFASSNGIELVALYPNSTHSLQPLDVAVFRPL